MDQILTLQFAGHAILSGTFHLPRSHFSCFESAAKIKTLLPKIILRLNKITHINIQYEKNYVLISKHTLILMTHQFCS